MNLIHYDKTQHANFRSKHPFQAMNQQTVKNRTSGAFFFFFFILTKTCSVFTALVHRCMLSQAETTKDIQTKSDSNHQAKQCTTEETRGYTAARSKACGNVTRGGV